MFSLQSKNGKCVRIFLTVILACQTILPAGKTKNDKLSRNDLTCKVTYCSVGKIKRFQMQYHSHLRKNS